MDDFDERVRQHAYRLWVEEGCPEGRADIHWDKARELVAIEQSERQATKPVAREAKPSRAPEPTQTVKDLGEFPTLADQGKGKAAPQRQTAAPRAAAARQTTGRKTAEPKSKSPPKGR
jgi:hypothetical protein